jgi:hypothetical protein
MPFGDGYSVGRSCTDEQAMHAVELRELKELLARKEQARKARFKRTRRVPKEHQAPTWREEMSMHKRKERL